MVIVELLVMVGDILSLELPSEDSSSMVEVVLIPAPAIDVEEPQRLESFGSLLDQFHRIVAKPALPPLLVDLASLQIEG